MENNQQQAGAEALEQSAGASESATETTNEGSQGQQQAQESQGLAPEAQKIVNDAIGRQHAKFRDEQTRANDLEAENQRLKAQMPQELRPEVPTPPDPLDDDFEKQLEVRDTAIREAAAFDARREMAQTQAVAAANATQNERQASLTQSAQTYTERAQTLGMDNAELQVAGQTVAAYGVSDELVEHILNDEQGPLITRYLAGNLNELETLRAMPPMQAAVHLATHVVPKITAVPTNTGAPPPSDGLSGGGAPPAERGPEGCTYA